MFRKRECPLIVEGVAYWPYRVEFWVGKKRYRWVRWAPADMYAREAVARELDARGLVARQPFSVTLAV